MASPVPLSRGQKWPLPPAVADTVEIVIQLGLPGRTVDLCCFGLDPQGRLSDDRYMVFYNQRRSPAPPGSGESGR